ncbi:hypothetical protein [Nostoc sp.]|uniref:hypothetical protein n=1 Tax=Nostoc sp. TaxID=1180 RepID=UPI002FFA6098
MGRAIVLDAMQRSLPTSASLQTLSGRVGFGVTVRQECDRNEAGWLVPYFYKLPSSFQIL